MALRLLKRENVLKATAIAVTTDRFGTKTTTKGKVTLRLERKKRRK